MQIIAGSTDVSISIYCRALSGAALTGKVAADFALTYRRAGANVALSLSNLASVNAAHSDGGLYEVGQGEYRLDLPDAACATGADQVSVTGTVDGGVVLGYPIQLDAASSLGTGARSVVFTVTDSVTLATIQGATVRLYRTGSLDRTGQTISGGTITFLCDVDATWSYTVTHPLYTGGAGTVVVDGNEAVPVALVSLSWPASTEPDTVTVRWKVKSNARVPVGVYGAIVYLRMLTPPTTDGLAWGKGEDFQQTNASGYVYFANVPIGCTVRARVGATGEWTDIEIPATATTPYDAGELLGVVP